MNKIDISSDDYEEIKHFFEILNTDLDLCYAGYTLLSQNTKDKVSFEKYCDMANSKEINKRLNEIIELLGEEK